MNYLLLAAMLSCFIPFSIGTALGEFSLPDLLICVMAALSLLYILSGRAIVSKGPSQILGWSAVVYFGLLMCCFASQGPIDLSSAVKFFIFLVAIPTTLVVNMPLTTSKPKIRYTAHEAFLWGATTLAVLVLVQIARGSVRSGGGDHYYVFIINAYAHKNSVGALLTFGVVSGAWMAFREGKAAVLPHLFIQILATLVIGNRSSTLVQAISIILIVVFYGFTRRTLLISISTIVLSALLITLSYYAGFGSLQMDRLTALQEVGSGQLGDASSRFVLWEYAWERILASPVVGYGFGNFIYTSDDWLSGRREPHNVILQVLYAVGAVGFVLLISLLAAGLAFRTKSSDRSRVLVFLLSANLLNSLVGIVWIRGEGHLFWISFFIMAMRLESRFAGEVAGSGQGQDRHGG